MSGGYIGYHSDGAVNCQPCHARVRIPVTSSCTSRPDVARHYVCIYSIYVYRQHPCRGESCTDANHAIHTNHLSTYAGHGENSGVLPR